jgi:predicted AAA+ superfamily ATPase
LLLVWNATYATCMQWPTETSFQALRLVPYARNRTKRLIKTPKLYWNDVGLSLHLGGGDPAGAHLENYALTDLLAWLAA